MHPLRRPTRSTIHYHGTTHLDEGAQALLFSINGVRWEYTLPGQAADACIHIVRKVSAAKALAYAKPRAGMTRCLDPDTRMSTLLRHRGANASRAKRMKVTLPNV